MVSGTGNEENRYRSKVTLRPLSRATMPGAVPLAGTTVKEVSVTTLACAPLPRASRARSIALGPRPLIAALMAVLCAAVVAASAVRTARSTPESLTEPAPKPTLRQWENAALRGSELAIQRDARSEIDALAGALAKRYRVSADATRSVVSTAYREGSRIGLDPLLIIAVIAVESRFNPIAESEMGAQGLMQVIPRFHKEQLETAAIDSVLDPHANIRLGARILKDYIRSGGTEVAGLQRYNGSTGDESNAYAQKVLGEKQRLKQSVERVRTRGRA
jgi:soluble lytic murein transglycosylase-like protein